MPSPTESETTKKPELNTEIAAVGADDIGVQYVDQLRVSGDTILSSRGAGDLAVYEKLLSDWQVYSTFQQRRTSVIEKEWYVEPGADDAKSIEAANYLEANLRNLPWDDVCRKQLMAEFYGFSVTELLYKADGTKIQIAAFKTRKPRRFRFDRDGNLRLITKSNPQGTVMPPNKFWITRFGAEDDDDPYGQGLASILYWLVWFKRNSMRFWALFVETFAKGRWVASHPEGLKPDKLQEIRRVLAQVTQGGSAAISDNILLKLVEGMRDSGGDYQRFVEYLDRSISKVVLSQTMTTDSGSSRSQSETHADVKEEVTKASSDMLCESFNVGPAVWLTNWNYPGAVPPKVWRRCEPPEDTEKLIARDKGISELGYEPTPEYIEETYGPGFVKKQPIPPPSVTKTSEDQAFAEGDIATKEIVEEKTSEWRPALEDEVEDIERLLEECGSLSEFRDRLGEIAARSPTKLTESLAQTMFAARVAGSVGIDLDGHEHD